MELPSAASGNVRGDGERGRRLIFWVITIAIPLTVFELFGLAAARLAPTLFDQRDVTLAVFTADAFGPYRAARASRTLGWENPAATTEHLANCGHVDVTYTFD